MCTTHMRKKTQTAGAYLTLCGPLCAVRESAFDRAYPWEPTRTAGQMLPSDPKHPGEIAAALQKHKRGGPQDCRAPVTTQNTQDLRRHKPQASGGRAGSGRDTGFGQRSRLRLRRPIKLREGDVSARRRSSNCWPVALPDEGDWGKISAGLSSASPSRRKNGISTRDCSLERERERDARSCLKPGLRCATTTTPAPALVPHGTHDAQPWPVRVVCVGLDT